MNVTPLLLILFLISSGHGEGQKDFPTSGIFSTTNTQKKLETSKEASCPDPTDIEPCECVSHGNLTMDCSKVEDEEQLRKVFSAVFPTTDFYDFQMNANKGVKVLEDGVFGDVSFVEFRITDSALETVMNDALTPSLSTLTLLYIVECELATFPFERLQEFTSLKNLHLAFNNLHSLPPLSSSSLQLLNLLGNPISRLSTDVFTHLTAVEWVHLEECSLTEITPGTFKGLPKLEALLLTGNNISHLQSLTFDFTSPFLWLLGLVSNNINRVEVDAFSGMSGPGVIALINNALTTLEEEVWRPVLEDKIEVQLAANPLSCGCDVAWLVRNQELLTATKDARCADGRLLTDLDPADFDHCD